MAPSTDTDAPDAALAELLAEANTLQPKTIALRRQLHRQPEQGLVLPDTQEAILRALDRLPLEIHRGSSSSSVTAVLRGSKPGPAVLLRGDMDALPLHEETGDDFASETPGTMHACGHDTHVAMLASAARLLSTHTRELAGSVVFMFQPGEEGYEGARYMIDEGVLDAAGERVSSALGLHIDAGSPSGMLSTRPGTLMASADSFTVRLTGQGGHGSMPHTALDPVPAAAAMVGALQTMVTRRVDISDPAVVTVGRITAGTTNNIIPETAELEGTIRALSEPTRRMLQQQIDTVCSGIAAAHGCELTIEFGVRYPATVTDTDVTERTLHLAQRLLGTDHAAPLPHPIMGAEDFSHVLREVPGTFAFLGACPPGADPTLAAPNHSNRVHYDEAALPRGVAMHAAFALHELR